MGLANVQARFKSLLAEPGTIAHDVHSILMKAATDINELVEEQPVLFSIVQHLEMAAHLTVSSPTLATSPANPTQAGAAPTSATTEEATTSPQTSSTPNSNDSGASSSVKSKG